jgi:hypothetical protein
MGNQDNNPVLRQLVFFLRMTTLPSRPFCGLTNAALAAAGNTSRLKAEIRRLNP